MYSEASYFDGYHFAHIAAWYDHLRATRRIMLMQRNYT